MKFIDDTCPECAQKATGILLSATLFQPFEKPNPFGNMEPSESNERIGWQDPHYRMDGVSYWLACDNAHEWKSCRVWTVAVFEVDQAYGGPEEGGWYYAVGAPAPEYAQHTRIFLDKDDAHQYARELNGGHVIAEANGDRPEISSVLSEGRFQAATCDGNPEPYPATKPHYE